MKSGIYCLVLLCLLCNMGAGQQAYDNEAQLMVLNNKYKNNQPVDLENIIFTTTASKLAASSPCHQEVDLVWQATLPPITSTPILVDLEGDGRKEVLAATSLHYVEILQGEDGAKTTGWPFGFPKSSFLSNPLVYDIDRDGINDIVVITMNGEIVFLRSNGQPLYNKTLVVPPLPVQKKWYEGLDDKGVDVAFNLLKPKEKRTLLTIEEEEEEEEEEEGQGQEERTDGEGVDTQAKGVDDDIFPETINSMSSKLSEMMAKDKKIDPTGFFTDPALQSLELFLPSSTPNTYITHLRTQQDPLYSPQYLHYLNTTLLRWPLEKQRDYVLVDAHVLAPPVIADLDGDGDDELIVAVSYYFDKEFYSNDMNKANKIPYDVDIEKYVAGAVVVFDLTKMDIEWVVNLDLTTDHTSYRAYMYSSPTIADINADGKLDIIVTSALGLVYALNNDGTSHSENFPILMDAIMAPAVVEDVNGDGAIEIIVVDTNSNIVCYNGKGEQLWENRLAGFPDEAPTIGDIDGNGILDIVVGTNEGHIWVFQGTDGALVNNYPVKLKGRVHSQVLLLDAESSGGKGMHLIVHSLDGHVYIIEGPTGCADKIDVGEPSYSMVLADDLTGNGFVDLLVTAKSGNIYCLGTSIPFHPSMAWLSNNQHRNSYTSGKHRGIHVLEQSRQFRDITGTHFFIAFEIVDNVATTKKGSYDVYIRYGSQQLFYGRYSSPGVYIEEILVPPIRAQVTVTVEMVNSFGLASFDTFGVSFNLQFHRTIKWIVIGPFVLIATLLFFVKDLKKEPLL